MNRHTLTLLLASSALLGCSTSHTGDCTGERPDCVTEIAPGCCDTSAIEPVCASTWACPAGTIPRASCAGVVGTDCMAPVPVPGPGGASGVCCPVGTFAGCNPMEAYPAGGWAPTYAECPAPVGPWFDGPVIVPTVDEWGCGILRDSGEPCGFDGGLAWDSGPATDAGPAPSCAGRNPAACMGTPGCVPVWDDLCCPTCTSGGCADCTNLTYFECRAESSSCPTAECGLVPLPICDGGIPDCSEARRVDEDSCDIAGCVPVVPPIDAPPLVVACVPVTADSCTVACRRVAPNCPAGTFAEGDGFCYTDRCIPAFVCE